MRAGGLPEGLTLQAESEGQRGSTWGQLQADGPCFVPGVILAPLRVWQLPSGAGHRRGQGWRVVWMRQFYRLWSDLSSAKWEELQLGKIWKGQWQDQICLLNRSVWRGTGRKWGAHLESRPETVVMSQGQNSSPRYQLGERVNGNRKAFPGCSCTWVVCHL